MPSIQARRGNYQTQIIVQRLNYRGAVYIEQGEYDKAIEVLVRALRLWGTVGEEERYSCCSIDDCILQGRRKNTMSAQSMFNRNRAAVFSGDDDDKEQQEDRFIYRQPIVTIRRHFSHESNVPGGILPMIITLNLAMANHLSTLKNGLSRPRLQKCLRLYGLAHQMQTDSGIFSPHATMIISNNVGEIHRITNNQKKYTMCLNHLLSTMMYVVEKTQKFEAVRNQTQYSTSTNMVEWDGFLRNTSELILHKNCAGAA